MKDTSCIRFLQWALPRLHMRWPGFRKVRGQVCKRIDKRLRDLELAGMDAYRAYLENHPSEWDILDGLCRVTISKFYRDKRVFDCLGNEVLPALARMAAERGDKTIRCWSAGCASGEEAYSVALLWNFMVRNNHPGIDLHITATDIDRTLLDRAERACYPFSSVNALPNGWLDRGFSRMDRHYCLRPEFRDPVRLVKQDIRHATPEGPFHMLLCRNLALTYFDRELQPRVLERIGDRLLVGGALVVGVHESLPHGVTGFDRWVRNMPIYRKTSQQ